MTSINDVLSKYRSINDDLSMDMEMYTNAHYSRIIQRMPWDHFIHGYKTHIYNTYVKAPVCIWKNRIFINLFPTEITINTLLQIAEKWQTNWARCTIQNLRVIGTAKKK